MNRIINKTIGLWREAFALLIVLLVFLQFFSVQVNIEPRIDMQTLIRTGKLRPALPADQKAREAALLSQVLPERGVELPVAWGDLGMQMVRAGVIDQEKFEDLYARRGGLSDEERTLLLGESNGNLRIDTQNADYLLNLLWAFGLGNKSMVLEKGPMMEWGGDAGNFASTGGWTLARGDAMDHYGMHAFVTLTPEQEAAMERVAKNVYRPCCGNSTYFPDCNHGMAMLGLLQLMAGRNVAEEDMYRYALAVNSFWFPDTYLAIAEYKARRGVRWEDVNPQEVLGADYSSGQGYARILQEVQPAEIQGGSCGI
ncbi:MAG: hypothetical protein HYW98_00330 [Candidatus Wildermuthbacteria bacterium]|nr:hypothetical protein [Candidatus Wildermuthbacteria bacterium]